MTVNWCEIHMHLQTIVSFAHDRKGIGVVAPVVTFRTLVRQEAVSKNAHKKNGNGKQGLTTDDKICSFRDEGIFGAEGAGSHLALPNAVVVLEIGVGDPE